MPLMKQGYSVADVGGNHASPLELISSRYEVPAANDCA